MFIDFQGSNPNLSVCPDRESNSGVSSLRFDLPQLAREPVHPACPVCVVVCTVYDGESCVVETPPAGCPWCHLSSNTLMSFAASPMGYFFGIGKQHAEAFWSLCSLHNGEVKKK